MQNRNLAITLTIITAFGTWQTLTLLKLQHQVSDAIGNKTEKCELNDDSMFALYVHIDDTVELARQEIIESTARIAVEACQ
jgi:hypothetical protein